MSQLVPTTVYDWVEIDENGLFLGFIDSRGNRIVLGDMPESLVQTLVNGGVETATQQATAAARAYTDAELLAAFTVELDGATITDLQSLTNAMVVKFAPAGGGAGGVVTPTASAAVASGDVTPAPGQTAISITQATWTTGAGIAVVNGRVWFIDINNGGPLSFPAVSASYNVPASAEGLPLKIIETAFTDAGPVSSTSATYIIAALAAAPTTLVAPTISPASPSGSDTLVLGGDTWNNDDGSLTYTVRWVTEWTATASLAGGATSATLSQPWTGSSGARTLTFSNGDSRSGTCNEGSTAVTWTGALSGSATATIGVSVNDTDRNMGAIPQMEGHVVRSYIIATNGVGSSAEVQASNTVTPTTTTTDTGVAWTGLTSTQWTNITDRAAVTGDTLAAGAQAAVAALPTTGGVTVAVGGDLRSALAANTRVFVAAGSHNISAGTYLQLTSKEFICLSGIATVNLSACTTSTRYGAVRTQNSKVSNIRFDNAPSAAIADFGGSLINRVLVDHFGNQTPIIASGSGLAMEGSGTRVISFEARHGFSHAAGSLTTGAYGGNAGGDSDGITNHGGANFFADAHAVENSDDGWDFWNATAGCHLYYCSAVLNGRNSLFPASNQLGDGNGFKYGQGTAGHYNNWSITDRNRTYGHNWNSNLTKAIIKGPTNIGNESGPYAFGGSGEPAGHYTVIA